MAMHDIVQTVFKLSRSSELVEDERGTPEMLQDALREKLRPVLANSNVGGELVWGPCVFQHPEPTRDLRVADQVMYMAKISRSGADTYVVAIAGTNANSTYDIIQLDLNVSFMTLFPHGVTPQGCTRPTSLAPSKVSRGTALGITNLLEMRDADRGNLQDFLNGVANSAAGPNASLVFTGHSLGGALAPALALWLYPRYAPRHWKAVHVLATAGPAPGDEAFSAAFGAAFPFVEEPHVPADYGFWNKMIWNRLDVVPHAWTDMWTREDDETKVLWDVELEGQLQNAKPIRATSLYGPLTQSAIDQEPKDNNLTLLIYQQSLLPLLNKYARLPNELRSSSPRPDPIDINNSDQFQALAYVNHIPWYDEFFRIAPTAGGWRPVISILLSASDIAAIEARQRAAA